MEVSILIVSKNRKYELEKTLSILKPNLDLCRHEVLVFLDGCNDDSKSLINLIPWVKWYFVDESLGASKARNNLYIKAKGTYLIGLDDDAHPLNTDFIQRTITIFTNYPKVGIISFEEVKGIFNSNNEAYNHSESQKIEYFTNDFKGCGFAIRKNVYLKTNGFPLWLNIYGEESCLALEVMAKGYDIIYSNDIKVNHRINRNNRKSLGRNYFRFEQQLKNSTVYYLIYYKNPILNILKLYIHNFRNYGIKDYKYFKLFFKVLFISIFSIHSYIHYRNPIDKRIIAKRNSLKPLKY